MILKMIGFVFLVHILSGVTTIIAQTIASDNEIEVKLQFFEYELEDYCVSKDDAEWAFLNGTKTNLTKLLEVELKESEFYKKELEVVQKHSGRKFKGERLQRLIDIFSHPGAPLLGNTEFREYRDYSIKLYELMGTMAIENPLIENSTKPEDDSDRNKTDRINYQSLNSILFTEKNVDNLKKIWIEWHKEVARRNKKTKYDFVQQLSILDLEAEQNGEEELSEYWLKMSDITGINYDSIGTLWEEIVPLYNKLKHFMISLAFKNFGKSILLQDNKLIPNHILGSTVSYDWVTAAEKLGAFDKLNIYKELKSSLLETDIEDIHKVVDSLTSELGTLPQQFYEKSRFNVSSEQCRSKISNYCEKNHIQRVMICSENVSKGNLKLRDFLRIAENIMKIKHIALSAKEEEENGYLLREGPRDSALYEAIESSSALYALRPENLKSQGFIKNENNESDENKKKQELFTLIIGALHVLPRLPYYLASDLWRINALREIDSSATENEAETTLMPPAISTSPDQNASSPAGEPYDTAKTYDVSNLTSDWWSYRNRYQGLGSPDGAPYEDYLQDWNIIWNRPYISKFLGTLLQFQILEHLTTGNQTVQKTNLANLMRKGKSQPWQILIQRELNITKISSAPLMKYFQPLEEFLDRGIKFKDDTEIFTADEFNFLPPSSSLKPGRPGSSSEKPGESSDTLFFSLIVIAAVGVVAVIVTIGRRRYKKRQRIAERKRRLADL